MCQQSIGNRAFTAQPFSSMNSRTSRIQFPLLPNCLVRAAREKAHMLGSFCLSRFAYSLRIHASFFKPRCFTKSQTRTSTPLTFPIGIMVSPLRPVKFFGLRCKVALTKEHCQEFE